MPQLDFALICDYVRADGGIAHALGGGFDQIHAEEVPTGRNVGVWARVLLARNECGRQHRFELIVQEEDGEHVAEVQGTFEEAWPDERPPGGHVGVGIALNIGVPFPRFGEYSFDLLVNDSLVKSIPMRVAPPPS